MWKVRDSRIKNAMDYMKTKNPWSVEKFINEVSNPDWDPTFSTIDQGMNFFICQKKSLEKVQG